MAFIKRQYLHYVVAAGAGLFVALLGRFVFASNAFKATGGLLMLCFLVLIPMALGAVTAHFTPLTASKTWRMVLGPVVTVMLFLATALLFHLEGMICVLIISPLFLLTSWLGALLYTTLTKGRSQDQNTHVVATFALLPFLVAPLEGLLIAPDDFRRVENSIVIEASPAVVWQHIIRVPPIQAQDLGPSLVDDIGFPRPVEATLSHEGVGGVRRATFERGVEFIETVDVWQPERRLSFSIVPNTATIPPTTFDEHVLVGGRFLMCCAAPTSWSPPAPAAPASCSTANSASAPVSTPMLASGPIL